MESKTVIKRELTPNYLTRLLTSKIYLSGAFSDSFFRNILTSISIIRQEIFYLTTLNTFYLRLYGVGHMVKDNSNTEKENLLFPILGYCFQLATSGH